MSNAQSELPAPTIMEEPLSSEEEDGPGAAAEEEVEIHDYIKMVPTTPLKVHTQLSNQTPLRSKSTPKKEGHQKGSTESIYT